MIGFSAEGDGELPLPMEGSLPPDLQGMLYRVGPAGDAVGTSADAEADAQHADSDGFDAGPERQPTRHGMLHAVELRDGKAVSYRQRASEADASVFWHAESVLALPESGLPSRYSRLLAPEAFEGGLTVPIASHVHRQAADGGRVLFAVDDPARRTGGHAAEDGDGSEDDVVTLRIGEWDAAGALRTAQAVELERATWQHDIGVTAGHVVFIESPTEALTGAGAASVVPFGWAPGGDTWMGVVRRGGDGNAVRWFRLDPCLVTHVLGAYEEPTEPARRGGGAAGGDAAIVLYVCRYESPEAGQPVDRTVSVVGSAGLGRTALNRGLAVLERWRIVGTDVERTQVDDRHVEYPRVDPNCEGGAFRYGYCVELAWDGTSSELDAVTQAGLLKFDLGRDEVAPWSLGPGRTASEPLFVRAADGHGDDEGWLLTVVDDPDRHASDLYVLDASALGRRRPEAVIHLPERLPFRSHGEWVPADHYR